MQEIEEKFITGGDKKVAACFILERKGKNMSIFDRMMEKNAEILAEKEQAQMEITRLSKAFGEPFIVSCAPISQRQIAYVAEAAKNIQEQRIYFVLECCRVEGKKFSDKVFLDWTGCIKGEEVVKKLFRAGEISGLYQKISALSGYGEDAIRELKN